MKKAASWRALPPVYSLLLALLIAAVAGPAARGASAQVDVSVDQAMVKGAPAAPVTIVEFSDYQ